MSIPGFSEETKPLSDNEMETIKVLERAFNSMKPGKDNAISSSKILDRLLTLDIKTNDIRLRKMINYIRINFMVSGLCSNNKGYFIAQDKKEFDEFLLSLNTRALNQYYTLKLCINNFNNLYPDDKRILEKGMIKKTVNGKKFNIITNKFE